jgi:hypothetical protein
MMGVIYAMADRKPAVGDATRTWLRAIASASGANSPTISTKPGERRVIRSTSASMASQALLISTHGREIYAARVPAASWCSCSKIARPNSRSPSSLMRVAVCPVCRFIEFRSAVGEAKPSSNAIDSSVRSVLPSR